MLKWLLIFLFLAGNAFAQSPNQPKAVSVDSAIRSIIVKFRTSSAMSDPSLIAKLQAVSATSDVLQPVFKMHPVSKGASVQSISVTDTIGLNRIVQIALRNGLSAADAVQSLSSASALEYVEPNYFYHIQRSSLPFQGEVVPNDPLFYAEWWLMSVNAPEAWEITEGDSTIHIGFVDTGVDWLHPDLKFQFAINPLEDINHDGLFEAWPSDSLGVNARGDTVTGDIDGIDHDGNGYANDVIGYNFVSEEYPNVGDWASPGPIPVDQEGHGTAMAGILAAQQNNGIGISGLAPKCKLVALRAFDANGTGEDKDISSAIVYAADNHIQILNLSFGDIIPSLLQRDAIRYAISKGVTIFASSGNDGTTGPNYPSDFDEVVSVGASPRAGYIDFTTHGQELDVVAPGIQVFTTQLGGGYDSVSGTSAASPIAAGTAAILLSKNPSLTPIELRSIIESTTDVVGDRAHTANGQVDAYAALSYPGSAAIKMVTPHTLDEFHIGDTIQITGDATSTLFTGYSLSWSKDYQKDTLGYDQFGNYGLIQYDSVVGAEFDSSNSQILNGTLGALDTRGFDTGTYTIIFAVGSSDNRSTQERCNIYMASALPKFVLFSVDSIWVNTERGLLVQATTNIPAQLEVRYSSPGAIPSTIGDDLIGFEHSILINSDQAETGVPLEIEAVLITPNGDSSVKDTIALIPDEAVSQDGFVEKPYSLPAGFLLDTVLSLPIGDEVIENPYSSGVLTIYRFDSATNGFLEVDSLEDPSIPMALGNTQGDNRPELLVQYIDSCGWHQGQTCGVSRIYKQNLGHSILGDLVFNNDTIFASTFAKLDTSSKQDIVGVIDSEWMAYEYNGGSYSLLGSGVNSSQPDFYNPNNNYSWPNVVHAALSDNGVDDLITLDDDADLIVYGRDLASPTGFSPIYVNQNNGASSGKLVAVGDFDGDGRPDIAFAYHPIDQQDTLDEYHPAYWTLIVLRNLGGMKFDTMYIDRFYGSNQNDYFYGPTSYVNCSVGSVRNVTGRKVDDLVVSFFPNFYVLEYDTVTHMMSPIWNYPLSTSPKGALAWDFDKNGKREFGFFAGDSIRFFEHSDSYTEQTPAPAGLTVTPRDTNRVDVSWAPEEYADQYIVLRVKLLDASWTLLDTTSSTEFVDTSVANRDTFLYSVAAFSSAYQNPNSAPAFQDTVFVHPMPRLDSAYLQGQLNIRVRTSQTPRTSRIFSGTVMIDDTTMPNAITMSSDSELVLALSNPLSAGGHRMRVTSFGLRDIYNSPFDTADYLAFNVPLDTAQEKFYIVQWSFDNGTNGLQIHVIFNEQPGAGALDVSHYSLSPYGTLTGVSIDTANSNALYIDVQGVQLVALGVPFVLCATGIESVKGTQLDASEGNCAGISLVEPDLSNIMVYPNPAKQSLGELTFARLTAEADIRIYTIKMDFIREITTTDAEGGVTWDLRDDLGRPVPSGEYLYYATGKNAMGVAVQGQAAKLVIVNDLK